MKFYRDSNFPLRVYLEEESLGEMLRLKSSLDNKYSPPENDYLSQNHNSENYELDSIIFHDDESNLNYIVYGLLDIVIKEADTLGISCTNEVSFPTFVENPLENFDENLLEGITLREYQVEGILQGLKYQKGIIQVHTGGGKTEMMIGVTKYLLEHSQMNILLCVPTTNLLYQTYDRMILRGISAENISLLGDGNKLDSNKRILVSTVQSAYQRLFNDNEWVKGIDCLMMDEAHHSKCRTWSTLIDRISPMYLLGFSAEPFHKDKDHIIGDLVLRGLLGPIIHRVTIDYLVEHGYLSKPYVVAMDSRYKGNIYSIIDWMMVNKQGIIKNSLRNELIRDVADCLIKKNKKPLLLVQQIAHGQFLAQSISSLGYTVVMLTGGLSTTVFVEGAIREKYVDKENRVLKDFNEGKIDVLIGTSTLDEGVDIPSLSAVILAGGGKGRIKTLQRIGRGLRCKIGDNTTIIVDFQDRFNVVTKSHYNKRTVMFTELNIPIYHASSIEIMSKIIDDYSNPKKVD